jgi:TP901 family phage tail tape measure protein
MDLTGNLERRAQRFGRAIGRMSSTGRRQLGRLGRTAEALGNSLDSLGNRYTGLLVGAGAAYAGARAAIQSAKLDKSLIQLRHTAGATADMTRLLREELFAMARESGQSVDSLLMGFNSLIQAGMEWDKALATIKAINPTMAVTGADAQSLASSLTVAANAFNFDLSQPGVALDLLERMTIAGRLGNAELEDLSSIFARVGVSAEASNLSFEETLALIEELSKIEKNPDNLRTLMDSTLRLFTNGRYRQAASEATGVEFFDAEGSRRSALAVLNDIAQQYQKLGTEAQRAGFMQAAFGATDLDTQRGLRVLLSRGTLQSVDRLNTRISQAGGTIYEDLDEALSNAVDQVARLKSALRDAADSFAQPINDAVENAIKYLLDEQGLSGKQIIGGTAVGAAAVFAGAKGGAALFKRFGSVAGGLATGTAIEAATGVQPVYVVNMPAAGIVDGGRNGAGRRGGRRARGPGRWGMIRRAPLGVLGGMGAGAIGTAGAAVGAAGLAGYGAGSLLNNTLIDGTETGRAIGSSIGEGIARALAFFGVDEAQRAVAINERDAGTLTIKVDQDGKVRSVTPERGRNGPDLDVDLGVGLVP